MTAEQYISLLCRVRAIVPRSALRYDATLVRDIDDAIADPADSAEILRRATNETEAQVRKDLADAVRWIADGSYDARNAAADPPVQPTVEQVMQQIDDFVNAYYEGRSDDAQYAALEAAVTALAHPPVQPTEPLAFEDWARENIPGGTDVSVVMLCRRAWRAAAPVQPTEPVAQVELIEETANEFPLELRERVRDAMNNAWVGGYNECVDHPPVQPPEPEVETVCAELLQYADSPDELQTYSEATARKAVALIGKQADLLAERAASIAYQNQRIVTLMAAPVQPTEPPCYHISKGAEGETVVTTTYEPPELSEEFIQETLRLADGYSYYCSLYSRNVTKSAESRAALEAHLRSKG